MKNAHLPAPHGRAWYFVPSAAVKQPAHPWAKNRLAGQARDDYAAVRARRPGLSEPR